MRSQSFDAFVWLQFSCKEGTCIPDSSLVFPGLTPKSFTPMCVMCVPIYVCTFIASQRAACVLLYLRYHLHHFSQMRSPAGMGSLSRLGWVSSKSPVGICLSLPP